MHEVNDVDEVYPAIRDLSESLKSSGGTKLAAVLDHRMDKVAWTTRDELLEELRTVLRNAVDAHELPLTEELWSQCRRIIAALDKHLGPPR